MSALDSRGRLSSGSRIASPATSLSHSCLIATAVATYWYLTAPERAFVITLSVLVVTCPCALALATPAAFATAGSRFSQLQLLVTNGNAIEVLSRATHIVFDKTGTLTSGKPALESVSFLMTTTSRNTACASRQRLSKPPPTLSRMPFDPIKPCQSSLTRPCISQKASAAQLTASFGALARPASQSASDEQAVSNGVYLGTNGHALRDLLSATQCGLMRMKRSVTEINGHHLSLASGDNEQSVAAVAESLGITDFRFDCSPEDKLEDHRATSSSRRTVVMVGDGINDAPVLAGADASIAPAHGALLAQTSADVIMLGESLHPLVTALTMSRKTLRIVRQNLVWAVVYNVTALPLAVAGLVPPWLAAIGMSASSLIVVLNALRLNRFE